MKKKQYTKELRAALDTAWNVESAGASLDRWLDVGKHECWTESIENLTLLVRLFGASWYFTRLVFFRGSEVKKYFDSEAGAKDLTTQSMLEFFRDNDIEGDLEDRFDRLRQAKNEKMLQIFLSQLENRLDQEKAEEALTNLAEVTLKYSLGLVIDDPTDSPQYPAILGMGRMAGKEMNYGSDLDLIFLYSGDTVDSTALTKRIQLLLRHIAAPTACGLLYEIDMRLRPHGTSGTLVSPVSYFIEYHKDNRDIWERQMMTRCRPVVDDNHLAGNALEEVISSIYCQYDDNLLRVEVLRMRKKVEDELGNPKGKFEIKRGAGGIMDIDFLTHYLQLKHAPGYPELKTASTRQALRRLRDNKLLTETQSSDLLFAYDYLKRIEGALRVADLKSISAFPQNPDEVQVLARAMGYACDAKTTNAINFIEEYIKTTGQVRDYFTEIVGELS